MSILFGVLVALGAMVVLAWLFARAEPSSVVRIARVAAALAAILAGIVMTIRGFAVLGVPMALAGVGFLLTGSWRGLSGRLGGQGPGARPGQGQRPSSSDTMSLAEARATLGVEPGASHDDIQRAYRELMKKVHPDTGGNAALARRVQQARDLLLGD
ncbi:MAG: J domain-containing protein [Caulobacterales bacterium]|uniref:J domain-containing protein n=1 Tax=Glycocaulis sp. TaxID=1969725 RepID=UPI003F9F5429